MDTSDFPKKYSHQDEPDIYEKWVSHRLFSPEVALEQYQKQWGKPSEDTFMIPMPPPNVTGVLHLGHAMMLAIEDSLVRYNRMLGKKTVWIPWTDHAWIATQVVVEKRVLKEEGKTRHDRGREKFLGKIWDWVKYSRSTIISQIKRMGSSADWDREQFTVSEHLSRAVRKSFSNLYQQGKIYRWSYIVNWCPRCQTVVSDIEAKYKDKEDKLYYIKYFINKKGDALTVATTRPETIFADVALAVNPRDRRYKKYIGKMALIPIINKPIPVIADEHVDPIFGTWVLKITPAHDPDDYQVGVRHDLPLDVFAIDKDGNFTEIAGEFAGRPVEEVFENFITMLNEIGNLEKIEDYTHSVPECERCNTRIQPMVSTQWFVNVNEAAKKSIEAVKTWETKIHPSRFNKTFYDWMENIQPWCISRQLRRGHRIPVWYCQKEHINVFDEDYLLDMWQKQKSKKNIVLSLIIFNLIADSRLKNPFNVEELVSLLASPSLIAHQGSVLKAYLNIYQQKFKDNKAVAKEIKKLVELEQQNDPQHLVKLAEQIVDLLENSFQIGKKGDFYELQLSCSECGDTHLHQDEDVLDTWFSSALWPFSILWWPEKTQDLQEFYPNDVLETGYDILFFRVARMMMMGFENMGQTPFKDIYLHWLIRDETGQKMSKSKGNVVDPLEIIQKYGADSLRFALLYGITPWNDIRFSNEKVEYWWRFINKIWNASRFIATRFDEDISFDYNLLKEDIYAHKDQLNDFDRWILYHLEKTISNVHKYFDKFMLGEALNTIVQFTWSDLCDWYIEISKKQQSPLTLKVLIFAMWTVLKLLHPFLPFVTEKLWSKLKFDWFLMVSEYPQPSGEFEKNYKVNLLLDLIKWIRSLKVENNVANQKVDIGISWREEILNLAKNYRDLISSLVGANDLILQQDWLPSEFLTDVVENMIIGIKLTGFGGNLKQQLQQLEEDLQKEREFIQNLRNLLSNPSFLQNAKPEVVKQKKQKMEEVQAKIVAIEEEIARIKMKLK